MVEYVLIPWALPNDTIHIMKLNQDLERNVFMIDANNTTKKYDFSDELTLIYFDSHYYCLILLEMPKELQTIRRFGV